LDLDSESQPPKNLALQDVKKKKKAMVEEEVDSEDEDDLALVIRNMKL
jgi:hypothetical protein